MMMMTFHRHIGWFHVSLPAYVFVISCLVYLFGRALLRFTHAFGPLEARKVPPLASGLDQAEKGSLKKYEGTSDEEIFQLEKRAFFSKVGSALLGSSDLSPSSTRLTRSSDMVVCLSPQQIP